MNDQTFEHGQRFERGEVTGEVRLGKLEAMYEELYAEVIDDGIITQEERNQLDKMADNLGLDRERLRRLEQALRVVHGTSASLIEEGAGGVAALARRMGFRDGTVPASVGLFERYRAVTRDVRAAYLTVLGLPGAKDPL